MPAAAWSPSTWWARASTSAESAPPLKATSTEPRSRICARAASSLVRRSGAMETVVGGIAGSLPDERGAGGEDRVDDGRVLVGPGGRCCQAAPAAVVGADAD